MRRGIAAAVVVAALAAGWVGWQRGWLGGGGAGPKSVLLISIDTLRADRLGSYGYQAAQTPVLDALAARGLRFDQAATTVPLTLPAHTSLLTGTFPPFHGVRDNGSFYVDDSMTTLAEVLKPRGYRTGGFVGAFVLDGRWGIAQGFDHYFDEFDLSKFEMSVGLEAAQRPGREVVDHALAWLAEDRAHPFFAWVHLYDPHSPYAPPEPYRSRFPATAQGAYDGEIAATDAEVGRLLDALEASGQLDSTIVVVLGDHGEMLGDHGEQQHGFFVYDAAARIPLIVAGPGVPARAVTDQVRIVDVMPTVLELVGIETPAEVQGTSLMPLARGEALDLLAYTETYYPRYHYGWSELTAVRDGRFKFIAAPRRELYDIQADPGETQDLAGENPRMADALERGLRDLTTRSAAKAVAQAPRSVDPAVEQQLRALGYVASSVTRAALEDKPRGDPKDKIGLYNLLKRAAQDSVEGRLDAGIAKVREVLAADPEVIEAFTMLGNMHTKADRPNEAIDAYKRALAVDPEHEGAAWSLALAYRDAGKDEEARAGFERVFQLNPRGAKSLYQLADIAMRRRQLDEAAKLLGEGRPADGALHSGPRARSARQPAGGHGGVRGGNQGEPDAVPAALQPGPPAVEGWPHRRGPPALPGRSGEEARLRYGIPLPGQGPAGRGRLEGRRAGCNARPGLGSGSIDGAARPLRAGGCLLEPGPRRRCAAAGGGGKARRTDTEGPTLITQRGRR